MTKGKEMSIARICHEANRAYCISLRDFSQPEWDDAPSLQRESAIAGVRAVFENPKITPQRQHELWAGTKVAQGWKYGKKKNVGKKLHPYLVEYESLPLEQKVKDELFLAIVKVFLEEKK